MHTLCVDADMCLTQIFCFYIGYSTQGLRPGPVWTGTGNPSPVHQPGGPGSVVEGACIELETKKLKTKKNNYVPQRIELETKNLKRIIINY